MVSIHVRSKVEGGQLSLTVPVEVPEGEVDVILVVNSLHEMPDAHLPAEFFELTYGCMANTPIERAPQGEPEAREPLL